MGVQTGRGLCIRDSVVYDALLFPAVLSSASVVAATAFPDSLPLPALSTEAATQTGELPAKPALLDFEER